MTSLDRRALVAGASLAALALSTAAEANGKPPVVAAPSGAKPITVTLRLTAKDPAAFKAHLLKVIPVTRIASGCRYSHS